MEKYYYFISGLPELNISDKDPVFSPVSFREELRDVISPSDFDLVSMLYYRFDITNLVHIIKGEHDKFDERGNYTAEALQSGFLIPESLPPFMEEFIVSSKADWEVSSSKVLQNKLTKYFVAWSRNQDNEFLNAWSEFNTNLRNLLAGLNCRKFNIPTENEVIGEYYEAEAIKRSKEKDFGLRTVIPFVDQIVTYFDNPDIAIREFALEELRWDFADELDQDYQFTVENLMTYVIKLQLIERSAGASIDKGKEHLDAILINIKQGYELPSEFE